MSIFIVAEKSYTYLLLSFLLLNKHETVFNLNHFCFVLVFSYPFFPFELALDSYLVQKYQIGFSYVIYSLRINISNQFSSKSSRRNSIASWTRATFQRRKGTGKVRKKNQFVYRQNLIFFLLIYYFFFGRKEEVFIRKSVRPFSQYANENKYKNAHTERENFGFADDGVSKSDNKTVMNGGGHSIHWYRDVVELRKKAEQYRVISFHSKFNFHVWIAHVEEIHF